MKMSAGQLRALRATGGAYSMVTPREDQDGQLTIDADEKDVLFAVRDEADIVRGKITGRWEQAALPAILYRGATRVGPTRIYVNFPKARRSELRLYFRVDGFNPSGYDVWYIFHNGSDICVGYCDPDTFLTLASPAPRSGAGRRRTPRVPEPLSRVRKEINARRGQPAFRRALLQRFAATCCVTGSQVSEVLEAAHIGTLAGADDHSLSNGLLLRSDIHTLFDLGLVAVNPESRLVHTSTALAESEYQRHHRAQLHAKKGLIRQLNAEALEERWQRFKAIDSLFS